MPRPSRGAPMTPATAVPWAMPSKKSSCAWASRSEGYGPYRRCSTQPPAMSGWPGSKPVSMIAIGGILRRGRGRQPGRDHPGEPVLLGRERVGGGRGHRGAGQRRGEEGDPADESHPGYERTVVERHGADCHPKGQSAGRSRGYTLKRIWRTSPSWTT